MKVGLDIHGVLDVRPEFFAELSKLFIAAGHEVHIITGGSFTDGSLQAELESYNIEYTHKFSIYDHLKNIGAKTNEELGIASRYPFPDETWNTVKAEYCERNQIDMHFDDMNEYLRYFTTPYLFTCDPKRNHRGQFGAHKAE